MAVQINCTSRFANFPNLCDWAIHQFNIELRQGSPMKSFQRGPADDATRNHAPPNRSVQDAG